MVDTQCVVWAIVELIVSLDQKARISDQKKTLKSLLQLVRKKKWKMSHSLLMISSLPWKLCIYFLLRPGPVHSASDLNVFRMAFGEVFSAAYT